MRHILPDLFGGCSLCQQPWPYHCFNLYSHRWRMDRSECGNNQRPNIPVSKHTTQRRNKIPIGPSSYGPSPYFSSTTRQVTLLLTIVFVNEEPGTWDRSNSSGRRP